MRRWGPFARLALFVLGHRRATAVAIAAITLLAAVIGLPPRVDTDLLALLPQDDPNVAALARFHEEEGGANLVTLAYEGDDEAALREVTAEMEAAFSALPSVRYVLSDLDPDLARRIGMMQLEPEELHELSARIQGALALGPSLNPIVTARLMDMGPLTDKIAATSKAPAWFGIHDGRARLLVRPTGSAHDPVFSAALMADVERIVEEVDLPGRGISLTWIGGAYRHNVEDVEGVRRDIAVTSAASAALVLLVVAVTFRRLSSVVVVFTPLIVGNLVNLAVVRLTIGALNTYTSFGTAVLIGLGIDFAVHLVARYREERGRGLPVEEAIAWAWDRTGPPCATAALTSAAGFVALGVAEFAGFSQLGMVLGVGLLLCLLAMLVCLPLLLAWLEPDAPPLLGARVARTASGSTYRLAPMGLMAFVLVTAFVGATRLPRLAFEYDLSASRRDGLAYAELSAEEQALARESYAPVVVSYDEEEALRSAHRRIERMIAAGELPHVARVISLQSVLPSDQEERLAALATLASQLEHPNLRYLPPPIVEKLLPLRGFDATPLTREDLPPELLGLLGADREGQHRLLLFPQGNVWDLRVAEALAEEVAAAVPDRVAAGEQLIFAALFRLVRRDMPLVGILAVLLVGALTAIDLRRWPRVLSAMGALLAGMIWAGAALQAVGVKLSMVNVVGVPILLGIGVDVVIHLMHRFAEEGPGGVRRALRTTGVAALVSALTTILSFSTLGLASNRGVRGLGTLVVIGLTTIVVSTAVVLPLAWAAGWRVTGRAPGQDTPVAPPRRRA